MFLDLLNENTELFVEATNIGIEPSMVGIHEINKTMLEESMELESSMVYTATKLLLNEGASEILLEENKNVFKNIFAKLKSIVMKMWAKMKEFFKNVKLFFQSLVQKGSKFAENYKDEINAISTVKIEGQKIDPSAIKIQTMFSTAETKANAIKEDDKTQDVLDKISETLVKQPSKSFRKGCAALLGYTPKPVEITYTGSQIMGILSKLNNLLNDVNKDSLEVDGAYKATISEINSEMSNTSDALEKEENEDKIKELKAKNKIASNKCSILKSALGLVNTAAGLKISALKLQASQAQKAAYKGIAESRKSKKK